MTLRTTVVPARDHAAASRMNPGHFWADYFRRPLLGRGAQKTARSAKDCDEDDREKQKPAVSALLGFVSLDHLRRNSNISVSVTVNISSFSSRGVVVDSAGQQQSSSRVCICGKNSFGKRNQFLPLLRRGSSPPSSQKRL